jgi:formate dehydrogenase
VNALASGAPEDLERLAGMAFLNGIPVRLEPVTAPDAARADEPELASVGA